jgi:hypothetical protein
MANKIVYGHLKRPDIGPTNPERIAKALELVYGKGLGINEASRWAKVSSASLCGWMSKYWFYRKIENPVTIVLKSKV